MTITLVWLRQDLRLTDNPALSMAAERGRVLPVHIVDDSSPDVRAPGGASAWWLGQSLSALKGALPNLCVLRGDPLSVLTGLIEATGAGGVFWNRVYEPAAMERDKRIKSALRDRGLEVRSFNGALLNEPWEIKNKSGVPFKVFTPYWRTARAVKPAEPLPAPTIEPLSGIEEMYPDVLPELAVMPAWASDWRHHWTPGEQGALRRLDRFVDTGLSRYAAERDRPDAEAVSRLSAHLHFGEISVRQIAQRMSFISAQSPALQSGIDKFMSELGWREFSHHLLFHFPGLPNRNWKPAFDGYPWENNPGHLKAWQKGLTGYPLVDAGLRELWRTGFMHNRVRMVTASFLIKHLRIDWRHGERWFWDTLLDADLANNAAGWQWVAGSGADAAPYFRIFNPITQGRKFDPDGAYVREWCPELSELDNRVIHAPFEASETELRAAGVMLGETYPLPIVDHATARNLALEGYREMTPAAES